MTSTIPSHVRAGVLLRDDYRCIAPKVDPDAGQCRDIWGHPIMSWPARDRGPKFVTMSHTKPQGELSMGSKTTATVQHLVTLCPGHHLATSAGSNWEAAHRNDIRQHLDELYPMKHIAVGLVVAAVLLVAMIILYFVWWMASTVAGAAGGAFAVAVFLFIVAASAFIDWRTEKEEA